MLTNPPTERYKKHPGPEQQVQSKYNVTSYEPWDGVLAENDAANRIVSSGQSDSGLLTSMVSVASPTLNEEWL